MLHSPWLRAVAAGSASALIGLGLVTIDGPSASASETTVTVSQSDFRPVERYQRGVDVLAMQYLLQAAGYPTLDPDGAYGPTTSSVVDAFKVREGITEDPVRTVGPVTWAALTPTLRHEDAPTGSAVKAVQVLLNKKRGARLTVNGVYDAATVHRVTLFQRHAGLEANGDVGSETWRALIWHFARPATTNICDQDPDGNTDANWGTGSAIGQFDAAAALFAKEAPGRGQVPFGDISWEHGGDIPGHVSHELGVDLDIWPIRTDSAQCTADRITWESPAYDRAATRQLIKAIRTTAPGPQVVLIFFNDPVLISEGLTQRYDEHDNHLHVRYR